MNIVLLVYQLFGQRLPSARDVFTFNVKISEFSVRKPEHLEDTSITFSLSFTID